MVGTEEAVVSQCQLGMDQVGPCWPQDTEFLDTACQVLPCRRPQPGRQPQKL